MGARDIVLDHEKPDEQEVWATFYVYDIWIEAGWRVIAAHERDLENLVAGNVTSHKSLMLAWITIHGVPLQSVGRLARWQQQLTHYPEALPQKIIDERINAIFTLQQSEQTVACYLRLIRDVLELVPASYDVARALSNVQESLRTHGFEE